MPEPIPRPTRFLFSFAFLGARRLLRLSAMISSLTPTLMVDSHADLGGKSPVTIRSCDVTAEAATYRFPPDGESGKLVYVTDEVRNLLHHAADRRCVFAFDDLVEACEPQTLDDKLVLGWGADL